MKVAARISASNEAALEGEAKRPRFENGGGDYEAPKSFASGFTNEQQLTEAVVSEGLRPVLAGNESGAPQSLQSLIERCWDTNPQNRPSFNDIVIVLISILGKSINRVKEEQQAYLTCPAKESKTLQSYQESIDWFSQGERFTKTAALDSSDGIWNNSSNDSMLYHPTLTWGSFSTTGRRETMEDTHFLMPCLCNNEDIYTFGIFDGHRGAAAAEFSARALPGLLQTLGSTNSPSDALVKAFIEADVAFRNELDFRRKSKELKQKDWHPGCTAVVALIVRDKLFVANAGDCMAILCRAGYPYALSRGSSPTSAKEDLLF